MSAPKSEEQVGRLTKASADADKACAATLAIEKTANQMVAAAYQSSRDAHRIMGEKYAALKAARKAAGLKDD